MEPPRETATETERARLLRQADELRRAAAVIREHRGGLGTTLAVLAETEKALRARARRV